MDNIIAKTISTAKVSELPIFPEGWYCMGLSDELAVKEVKGLHFFGRDLAMFRTESGEVAVIDAYCPHLGANLAIGGEVHNETIRCPFHGYYFDTNGEFSGNDYQSDLPRKSCIKSWAVQEENGLIMAYFNLNDSQPDWFLPDFDSSNYRSLKTSTFQLPAHVQDVNENSVDLGHFRHVHGYDSVEVLARPKVDGKSLFLKYAMVRDAGFLGIGGRMRQELSIQVHGMGLSSVDVEVKKVGIKLRLYVLTTPIDEKTTQLRITSTVCKDIDYPSIAKVLNVLPQEWLLSLIHKILHLEYKSDVSQDFDIWENKVYIANPAVSKGDGPIQLYRKYCSQFYGSEVIEMKNMAA